MVTGCPRFEPLWKINRGNPARAIELLQAAAPYDLSPRPFNWGLYARPGLSSVAPGQRSGSGVPEVPRPSRHRADFPLGALADLGLARAYTLQGDTGKARSAYQDFFALWKDAGPDIPSSSKPKPNTPS
jgi:eukaryotic-like serine/threonine-protein kinase